MSDLMPIYRVERERGTWTRWDAARRRNVSSQVSTWTVYEDDVPIRCCDSKHEASEYIAEQSGDPT